jgi:hypothetical protein
MCPDPALLVAYLDGTPFSRDAVEIDRHRAQCERCAALLASMRYQRAIAPTPSRWRSPRVAVAAGLLAVGGLGAWAVLSGLRGEPAGVVVGPASPSPSPSPGLGLATGAGADPRPADGPRAGSPPPGIDPPASTVAPDVPEAEPGPAPRADAAPPVDVPSVPDPAGAGILLRGGPGARVVWRVRDRTIERSIDGGSSWEVEYTADRPIRAGTVVGADVAWLVGEDGLVLRRTGNGWFGTNPPADGHVDAVRASSPSRATVTLDDGRLLSTDNGGITWSEP